MKLTRCANGHFYNAGKYEQCPHCNRNADADQDKTVALSPQNAFPGAMRSNPMPPPTGANNVFPGPFRSNPAVRQEEEDDVRTIPLPSEAPPAQPMQPIQPTVQLPPQPAPMPQLPPQRAAADDDDDVQTVSIYQRSAEPQHSAEPQRSAASAPAQNKWIEPAVGWFVIINGKERGRSVELKAGRNFIGRGASNDVVLSGDSTISREKHAILIYEPRSSAFLIQPGESRELFYLNDEVVLDAKAIKAYDILNLGKTKLVFIPFCGDAFRWEDHTDEADQA